MLPAEYLPGPLPHGPLPPHMNIHDGVHIPPHLMPYVLNKQGRLSKKKLARALLLEHGIDPSDIKGEGLREVVSGVKKLFKKGVRGSLRDAPPAWKSFMGKYGDWSIDKIYVCRKPIQSFVDKGLSLLTLGRWNKDKAKMGYDDMFHLYFRIMLNKDGKKATIRIEKNQRLNAVVDNKPLSKEIEYIELVKPDVTLHELVDKAVDKQGPSFYQYDGRNNNCQVFAMTIVEANDLKPADSSTDVKSFVKQNTEKLLKGMIGRIGRTITDIAGSADVLVQGGKVPTYADYLATL
jgi:hypothetical protein